MRKKLFAVIMSVMMMVTFMPAMAFAADTVDFEWKAEFSELWIDGDFVGDTTKVFDKKTGRIFVNCGEFYTSYYDFDGAYFADSYGKAAKKIEVDKYLDMINQDSKVKDPRFTKDNENYTFDHDCSVYDLLGTYIVFVKPAKMKAVADWSTDDDAYLSEIEESNPISKEAFEYDGEQYVDYTVGLQRYEAYEDVESLTFPVTAALVYGNETDYAYPNVAMSTVDPLNGLHLEKMQAEYKLYLDYSNITGENAEVHMEGMNSADETQTFAFEYYNGEFVTRYCGENQNFTVQTKGVKAQYREVNGTTWSETAPEMVNADDYKFVVKLTRGSKTLFEELVNVHVFKAPIAPVFKKARFVVAPGTKLTAKDVLAFHTFKTGEEVDIFSADQAAAQKIFDACVKLDMSALDVAGLGINNELDLDDLDYNYFETELDKLVANDLDVANFMENYKFNDTEDEAKWQPFAEFIYYTGSNDVTAPNQTKTFHVKNAKALKKNKTFKLKATCDYGKDQMTFTKLSGNGKIKVASNGKVTVKKGLKKGKYVVKVKVKALGGKATKKLTVKVVK